MKYTTIKSLFTAICDAIRNADGTSSKIKHQDIPDRITKLQRPVESSLFVPNITIVDIEYSTINLHTFDESEIEEEENTSWNAE